MTQGEFVTDVAATGALFSPAWLPMLRDVSTVAALLFPILGGIWLAVQIYVKVQTYRRARR